MVRAFMWAALVAIPELAPGLAPPPDAAAEPPKAAAAPAPPPPADAAPSQPSRGHPRLEPAFLFDVGPVLTDEVREARTDSATDALGVRMSFLLSRGFLDFGVSTRAIVDDELEVSGWRAGALAGPALESRDRHLRAALHVEVGLATYRYEIPELQQPLLGGYATRSMVRDDGAMHTPYVGLGVAAVVRGLPRGLVLGVRLSASRTLDRAVEMHWEWEDCQTSTFLGTTTTCTRREAVRFFGGSSLFLGITFGQGPTL